MENKEEKEYLNLMRYVLENGSKRENRTGIDSVSIFGSSLRYSLKENTLPLFTSKRVFFRGVVEELLFFIRGETDTIKLEAKGVNIWKGNTSREFLDKRGLTNYKIGSLGRLYGSVWRDFQGIDQFKTALNLLRTDPYSRRILVSAYDPSIADQGVLYPCHYGFQMYVDQGRLSLLWLQRSQDLFHGKPFNCASYAILAMLFAKAAKLELGELICQSGDTHIYTTHFDAVKEQLTREPFPFPKLYIDKEISSIEDMENLSFEDFRLENYQFHPTIKAPMAV